MELKSGISWWGCFSSDLLLITTPKNGEELKNLPVIEVTFHVCF
jgi:hypothetical protein